MNSKTKAHIAVLIGNFFFGCSAVAVKQLTPSLMPPLALNMLRVGTAVSLFWLLFLLKPTKASIQKKHLFRFIVCAAAGIATNQILYVKGAALTSPIHTSLLSLATPIAITIIAFFILKEQITLNKTLGLLLGIVGAALLIFLKNFDDKESSTMGDVFIIMNAISYAFYLVWVKPLMKAYHPLHVIRWVFVFGALIIMPIAWTDCTQIQWSHFQSNDWIALVFLVIGATFIAYMCMVFGIAKLGSSVTGTYIYTQPIFATIASMVLRGEQLTPMKLVAALFIFGGVYLVNYKKKLSVSEGLEVIE
jgi:drug/metabolite transporter (DMT)-like permease